jgi:hypothetical protein
MIRKNAGHGVHILSDATGNRIGTDGFDPAANAVEGNIITGNTLDGVRVGDGAVRNPIRGNSIHSNGTLGIDLAGDGVTRNDSLDPDNGPNQLQNYPVITQARLQRGVTRVVGVLNSIPKANFTIDVYANSPADPSGSGEGQRWIGTRTVTTNRAGVANFNESLDATVSAGEFITATGTDNAGNTSEFSAAIVLREAESPPSRSRRAAASALNANSRSIAQHVAERTSDRDSNDGAANTDPATPQEKHLRTARAKRHRAK